MIELWQKTLPESLPVSLDEFKKHLRIDDDIESDDDLMRQYILSAAQKAEHLLGREIIMRNDSEALADSAETVPYAVKQYILIEAGEYYESRSASYLNNYKTFHEHLLDPYILYQREDSEE